MTDERTELEFEARELLRDPARHIERLRQIHNRLEALEIKRSMTMDDKFLEGLNDEERADLQRDIDEVMQKAVTRRSQRQQQDLLPGYVSEMNAARGKGHVLKEIKEKYRKRGLDVDRVDFSQVAL